VEYGIGRMLGILTFKEAAMSGGRRATVGGLVSERVGSIPVSAIHEMSRLSATVPDVAFLSWARPEGNTPDFINEAAIRAIKDNKVSAYSPVPGLLELREAIANKLRGDNCVEASPDEILVTVGAIEGLSAAVMAVVDPGDEVLMPSPTYSTHAVQVKLCSAVPVFVPAIEEEGFRLDLEAFRRAVTSRTKAILFCSPSNPTGTVFTKEELLGLADIAEENDLVIITDESYEYFTFDGVEHFSLASVPELKKRTISCFTFTKTYVMTGWRVGYVAASGEMISQVRKAHIPLAICAPVVSQYAALAALTGPQDCIVEFREKYKGLRDLMCRRLDGLNKVFSYQKPMGAYNMFPKLLVEEGKDSLAFCKDLLFSARVSVVPGVAFGPTAEGHVRMSFCTNSDDINKAFDRMGDYFKAKGYL
jgi:aminotransferase